ncbi:hypothetical protein CAMRE0001_0019 [Campylobacter rectus RM3267]|uniref:Uncharacterized protein n=1 Tax=Campylobacter rectus RM3267 TaxID=553218 RepID=B9D3G5_CAMRE|nr:hypothetical protein CAMRE0001_0019 [Campylobacter rectus RM3267]
MAGYRQNVNLKFNRMSPRAVLRILFVIFGGGGGVNLPRSLR